MRTAFVVVAVPAAVRTATTSCAERHVKRTVTQSRRHRGEGLARRTALHVQDMALTTWGGGRLGRRLARRPHASLRARLDTVRIDLVTDDDGQDAPSCTGAPSAALRLRADMFRQETPGRVKLHAACQCPEARASIRTAPGVPKRVLKNGLEPSAASHSTKSPGGAPPSRPATPSRRSAV
ncbi:MAG TPA: hypothetical protein VN238_20520 [Solirubrobacteraceae bacterium]|nr:hypothetical protein [Solirubrobacteraceae bacterium]